MKTRSLILTAILAASMCLTACSGEDYGKTVEQGRCIAFGNGKVSFVRDINKDPKKGPKYENTVLEYSMPNDPMEIGPEPSVGNFIDFNADKKEVVVYSGDALKTVTVEVVDAQKGVERFDSKVKGHTFPMINKEKGEVTIYHKKVLATLKIPAGMEAESLWTRGDDVRVFSTEKGQARRFMNISKTNIFKK
ncbi:MAG: DUF4881 domain-containing protein [Desulfovibrio sp.]|nr:DUF4881 domain-containing protein [Desulfovibrio sp.]